MAGFASRAELSAVDIVLGVACVATSRNVHRRLAGRGVARFTGQTGMIAGQPELGSAVVIKYPELPPVGIVAGLAFWSQAAIVLVVLLMTGGTGGFGSDKGRVGVAFFACAQSVLADQGETRDIVIESDFLQPVFRPVTTFTARAELAFVGVIGAVAVYASCSERVGKRVGAVTGFALCLLMSADQGKRRITPVVKAHFGPFGALVAGFALVAHCSPMDILYGVTSLTGRGQVLVYFSGVAGLAADFGVPAKQRKISFLMVEGADIDPCRCHVAIFTFRSELFAVGFVFAVAVDAARWRFAKLLIFRVTTGAVDVFVTALQREIGQPVIKQFLVEQDDFGVAPDMVGMTMAAILSIDLGRAPVQADGAFQVRGNFLVAIEAERSLRAFSE